MSYASKAENNDEFASTTYDDMETGTKTLEIEGPVRGFLFLISMEVNRESMVTTEGELVERSPSQKKTI